MGGVEHGRRGAGLVVLGVSWGVLSLLVTSCGDDGGGGPTTTRAEVTRSTSDASTSAPTSATTTTTAPPLPGITVREALDNGAADPVIINGWVLVEEGHIRLCEHYLEPMPPACGGASVTIHGAIDAVPMTAVDTTAWHDGPVALTGAFNGSVFTIDGVLYPEPPPPTLPPPGAPALPPDED